MHATGKIFDKISLKLLGISFFGICDPWSEEGSQYSIFWYGVWGEMSNRKTKFKLLVIRGDPRPPIPSLSWSSWSPRKENPEKGSWSTFCNNFQKSEWEYFLSKFTARKVKDENEVANSLMVMVFNLVKNIFPFQCKKHFRAY